MHYTQNRNDKKIVTTNENRNRISLNNTKCQSPIKLNIKVYEKKNNQKRMDVYFIKTDFVNFVEQLYLANKCNKLHSSFRFKKKSQN